MSLVTLLVIILVVMLVGGNFANFNGGPYLGTGWQGGGLLGLVLIVVVILLVMGRLG
jgi:Protein of unknown function (DUF3309)